MAITLFEVSPRDGLQNQSRTLSIEERLALIERLVRAGFREIEVGSMVHPDWIPQMAGTEELLQQLPQHDGVRYWVLVPNVTGLERALQAGARHICVFVSASHKHNAANLNRTIEESMATIAEIVPRALATGVSVRGYLSMVFGCPFEGEVPVTRSIDLSRRLLDLGVEQVALGDTVGRANPAQVGAVMSAFKEAFGTLDSFALHLHDTNELAVTNAYVGYQQGVRTFDGALGGLGGCPYAGPRAKGNVDTQDLLRLFDAIGEETGLTEHGLSHVAHYMSSVQGLSCRLKSIPAPESATGT